MSTSTRRALFKFWSADLLNATDFGINDGIGNNSEHWINSGLLMIAWDDSSRCDVYVRRERVFDGTFIGTVIAILMNIGVHPKETRRSRC